MERLEDDWLTEGLIDFEYKKYLLLAYLKCVRDSFHRVELYPFLADLVSHYRNMTALKENKALLYERFPKQLSLDNLNTLEVSFKNAVEDDVVMREIEAIIGFSLPHSKGRLTKGQGSTNMSSRSAKSFRWD